MPAVLNVSGRCACAGQLLCSHTRLKHNRLEHLALGLLHTCIHLQLQSSQLLDARHLEKHLIAVAIHSCVPELFLQDRGSDCIMQKNPIL